MIGLMSLLKPLKAVEQKASILNMFAMFAISGIIAWAVFGVFEMQDQITSAMG